jgi:hypothetical protein
VTSGDPHAELAVRLRDAHRRIAALDAPPEVKQRTARRLIALTDTSKHDAARASSRLDALLADLDAGRLPEPGPGDAET